MPQVIGVLKLGTASLSLASVTSGQCVSRMTNFYVSRLVSLSNLFKQNGGDF